MIASLNTISEIEKDCTDVMDWEWTPDSRPVANQATDIENKIWKGKIKLTLAEDPVNAADQAAKSQRYSIVRPSTLKSSLGSSQNTGRK